MRAGIRNTVVTYAKTESQAPKSGPHPILAGVGINGLPLVAGGREEAVQTSAIEVDEA
jgi:hypothetical protein